MVEDESRWCNTSIQINDTDVSSYKFVLGNILENQADVGDCFQPCNALYYDAKFDVFDFRESAEKYGLYIQIKDTVETTRVNLAISPETLLTRIGGIIGVGKELMWVIIFFCDALHTIVTLIIGFLKN